MTLSQQVRALEEKLERLERRQAECIAFLRSIGKKDPRSSGFVARRALVQLHDGLRPLDVEDQQVRWVNSGPRHTSAREDCDRCHGQGVLDVGVPFLQAEYVLCPCVPEEPQ